ncbi:hypothetical protein H6A66_12030 [Bacteroides caecigallinarum]|uniref:hypothetical protein n=1 Tax=Bacteroides caecigallinarum TaxID=1411144 RepID=UPI00195BA2EF|nr:hypothetical protein [Bacteroides caecigallinarum]MBM6865894.1 hypothetical protein [Bacteroides caecigallinarum]
MITEDIIKETYIKSIVSRDMAVIYKTQAEVVRAYFYDSGKLYNFLTSSKPINLEGCTFWFKILPYLRFLDIRYREDMKVRRNLALYNRVIWGVLYNETLPDIRYGYTQDIRNAIRKDLLRALELEKYDKSW